MVVNMGRLTWNRLKRSEYDIVHQLFDANGNLIAEVYKGGHKWYPWSWDIKGIKKSGTSLTMRDAKSTVELIYLSALK